MIIRFIFSKYNHVLNKESRGFLDFFFLIIAYILCFYFSHSSCVSDFNEFREGQIYKIFRLSAVINCNERYINSFDAKNRQAVYRVISALKEIKTTVNLFVNGKYKGRIATV